ncbi:MAG: type I-E CRISPR-associated protein Cas7/Cse4/CasC [Proteobacteria bacterium]|nr:type I-E CRISPR-associated protein Cas7/Cse4/CasC [Pseudomonadota bacterium]
MSRFVQIHLLTSYPPANLNRDDQGRPKTAKMGGYDRLRVSSQSLKRAWRTSEIFEKIISNGEKMQIFSEEFPINIGFRSKIFAGKWLSNSLIAKGIEVDAAEMWSEDFSRAYGQLEKEENKLSQLAHISDLEAQGLFYSSLELIEYLTNKKQIELFDKIKEIQDARATKKKTEEIKKLNDKIADILSPHFLSLGKTSVDIALFGRMLASTPAYNVEAACQVAHAISVHPVVVEDDYFTAVDDLNDGNEDAGAAHIGETGFAAGLFYSYICINRELLIDNLGGDKELANKAIKALIEAAIKVPPNGKQNSFGSRAYASYVLAEKGDQQPRSLSVAFLKPVTSQGVEGTDFGTAATDALISQRNNMEAVYGPCADDCREINVFEGKGTLLELLKFVTE